MVITGSSIQALFTGADAERSLCSDKSACCKSISEHASSSPLCVRASEQSSRQRSMRESVIDGTVIDHPKHPEVGLKTEQVMLVAGQAQLAQQPA